MTIQQTGPLRGGGSVKDLSLVLSKIKEYSVNLAMMDSRLMHDVERKEIYATKRGKKTYIFHIELNRVRTYKILSSIMKESALTNLATQAFNIYTTFFNKKFFFIGYIISDFFRI